MAEVRWSPNAADDLESIVEHIATDSAQNARVFAIAILEKIEGLATFPRSGHQLPERDSPDLREISHANYRVIYRVHGEVVEILTIVHGARRLDAREL